METRLKDLEFFLEPLGAVAVGFSGGVDSSVVVAAAVRVLGAGKVLAVTADSQTLPARELRQARALAAVIEAELTGREKQPFRFKLLGEMVPLSRRTAVADLRGIKLVGFPAWFMWKTVYMLKLPTLASRLRVVLDWTVELFFERDVSELAVHDGRGD